MSDNMSVSIYCGDHSKIVVVLTGIPGESRRALVEAYIGVVGATSMVTRPRAQDGGSLPFEKVMRLEVPTVDQDVQVTKMHTLSSLLKLVGLTPRLSLDRAPTMEGDDVPS